MDIHRSRNLCQAFIITLQRITMDNQLERILAMRKGVYQRAHPDLVSCIPSPPHRPLQHLIISRIHLFPSQLRQPRRLPKKMSKR